MTPREQADALEMAERVQALMNSEASRASFAIQAAISRGTYEGPNVETIVYPDGSRLFVDVNNGNCFASL